VQGAVVRAEPMTFSHAEPEKESFVDAVAATYFGGIEMEARLCVPNAEEPQPATVRVRRKAEVRPWLYPPPY